MVCNTRCNMVEWLRYIWRTWTSCKIDTYFNKLDTHIQAVIDKCEKIEQQLDAEVKLLTEEVAMYKGMLHSITETVPDMMWCKDLDGKYVYANNGIKIGLLFDSNPIGKTDVELATKAKERFGADNHTFGEICGNSDAVVIEKVRDGSFRREDGRFLESGRIKGKMTYLEVFKAPWFVNGEFKGVVGTGRNMTEYVEAYRVQNCAGCGKMADIFNKYEYGE